MGLKLFKRNRIIQNVLMILIFSLFFLHIIYSIRNGESALNYGSFLQLLEDRWPISALFVLSFISVFFVKSISKYLVMLFLSGVFGLSFYVFFEDFNKIILLLTLTYFLVGLYFMGLWNKELLEAVYLPNFSLHDVEIRPPFKFNVSVETEEGNKTSGNLTNWNESGLFFVADELIPRTKKPVKLKINFEDIVFEEKGDIVTKFGKGFGIRFNFCKDYGNFLGWKEFYKIIEDRGYRSNG